MNSKKEVIKVIRILLMSFFSIFLFLSTCIYAHENLEPVDSNNELSQFDSDYYERTLRITDYLGFIRRFRNHLGPVGAHKKNEIEIVTDTDQVIEIEDKEYKSFISRGMTENEARQASQIGLIYTDSYWIWIRDGVVLPSGNVTTYNRLIYKNSIDGPSTVGVLPVLKDGSIVLILNYRHATRCWEIELTRGSRVYNETPLRSAYRELKEKTGFICKKMTYLGSLTSDSTTFNTVTPIYWASIEGQLFSNGQEFLTFTRSEIREALLKGYVEIKIQGSTQQVPFRDPLVCFALLQANLRKLF